MWRLLLISFDIYWILLLRYSDNTLFSITFAFNVDHTSLKPYIAFSRTDCLDTVDNKGGGGDGGDNILYLFLILYHKLYVL